MGTGEGLKEGGNFDSFMDYIHKNVCKWYSELDTVLASRHNVWPAYTNEDSDDNDSDASEDYHIDNVNSPSLLITHRSTSNQKNKNVILISDKSPDTTCTSNLLDISNLTNEENQSSSQKSSSTNTEQKQASSSTTSPRHSSPTKRSRLTTDCSDSMTERKSKTKVSAIEANKIRKDRKKTISDCKSLSSLDGKLPPFLSKSENHFSNLLNAHKDKLS